jgi:hypothetical protein
MPCRFPCLCRSLGPLCYGYGVILVGRWGYGASVQEGPSLVLPPGIYLVVVLSSVACHSYFQHFRSQVLKEALG